MSGADLDMIRALIDRMGIDPADLLDPKRTTVDIPTFADYVPRIAQAASAGARRTYTSYWQRLVTVWPGRLITEPSTVELQALVEATRESALQRRNAKAGHSAGEHMVSALRNLYQCAVNDGLIAAHRDPSLKLKMPRRLPSGRRALTQRELDNVIAAALNTGHDPTLDALLLRIHLETACRTGSALAIRPCDLDPDQCLVRLFGKGGTVHWQPISPTLMALLMARAQLCPDLEAPLLRRHKGPPITRRRYDRLWERIGRELPWVAAQQVSTHWLRYTTLTWVERNFGYATAQAFAAHAEPSGRSGTTLTYVRATIGEVAAALAALTGEPHPLVPDANRPDLRPLLPTPLRTAPETVQPTNRRQRRRQRSKPSSR